MNEIAAKLQALKELIPTALELPEEDDITEIEEELLVPLADEFKEFLLTASDVVYGGLEPVTVADPYAHTHLPEVAAVAWNRGLPRQLVPLCEYKDGYYAVSETGEVYLWSESESQGEESFDGECTGGVWDWVETVWLQSGAE